MQFEEFDKKVIEAAERHHPAYDEMAWTKMEKMLDKHLPQPREKKRRALFILLFLLLLGGGSAILILNNKGKGQRAGKKDISTITVSPGSSDQSSKNNLAPGEKTSDAVQSVNENMKPGDDAKVNKINNPLDVPGSATGPASNAAIKSNDAQFQTAVVSGKVNKRKATIQPGVMTEKITGKPTIETALQQEGNQKENTVTPITSIPQPKTENKTVLVETNKNVVKKDETLPVTAGTNTIPASEADLPAANTSAPIVQNKKNKIRTSAANHFFLSFSAAPDLSFAGNDKMGTVKLLGGAGIGYTFKDRLTVRTGFYSGRKVYTASPSSYNPPTAWWAYYPNLQKVDADCKVYEIPLSLSYNFGSSKKQQWFASTGISSLLMKQEVYNYYYKPVATGPVVSKKWTITDENKHYFSIFTLSAGYQRRLNKSVSISVEPYIKMPLAGVGFGKVKLNSTGILFSVGIKPFGRDKDKAISPR